MESSEIKEKLKALEKFRYPLIILIIGILLMLIPSGSAGSECESSDQPFQELLQATEGVGEVKVIVSESGVVVVCRGADSAKVRLDIIKAIASYTGFSADKITVLKMAD